MGIKGLRFIWKSELLSTSKLQCSSKISELRIRVSYTGTVRVCRLTFGMHTLAYACSNLLWVASYGKLFNSSWKLPLLCLCRTPFVTTSPWTDILWKYPVPKMNLAKVLFGGLTHLVSKSWLNKLSANDVKEVFHVSDHHFPNCPAGKFQANVQLDHSEFLWITF